MNLLYYTKLAISQQMIEKLPINLLSQRVSEFPRDTENLPPIPNIKQNIIELKAALLDANVFGIHESRIIIPKEENKSHTEIKEEIIEFAGKAKQDETLIFYYAGHGTKDERNKVYFTAKDTKQNLLEVNGIAMDFVQDKLAKSNAKRKIVILDCCYSGAFSKGRMGGGYQDEINQFTGSYVMASSDHNTLSQFNPDDAEQPTYFTQKLLQVLKEGIVSQNPFVETEEIYEEVKKRLKEANLPAPTQSIREEGNQIPFAKNPKFTDFEQTDFEKLKNAYFAENKDLNTIQQLIHQLDDFLEKYPKSTHKKEINTWLKVSEDEKEWIEACQKNKISAYREYQDKNPEGNYFAKASEKISEIRKKEQIIPQKPIKEEPKQELIIKTNPQSPLTIPLITPLPNKINSEMVSKINLYMAYVEGGTFEMGYKRDKDGEDNDNMIHSIPLHQVYYNMSVI